MYWRCIGGPDPLAVESGTRLRSLHSSANAFERLVFPTALERRGPETKAQHTISASRCFNQPHSEAAIFETARLRAFPTTKIQF